MALQILIYSKCDAIYIFNVICDCYTRIITTQQCKSIHPYRISSNDYWIFLLKKMIFQ